MENANVTGAVESAGSEDLGSESLDQSQDQEAMSNGYDQGFERQERSERPAHQQQMKELSDEYMEHMVKLKVNGKEVKKPLKEVIRLQQLEQASQAKMNEAAQVRRELKQREQREQQLLHLFKSDFPRFCQVMGADAKEIATNLLAKQYEVEQMSPAERRAMELEEKLKAREEEDKRREEMTKQEQEKRMHAQLSVQIDKELGEALTTSNLPKNKLFVQRTAAKMVESIERVKAGLEDAPLQAKDAVAKVIEDWHSDVRATLSTMDAKAIHQMLGPDVLKKIRTYEVERVTGRKPQVIESSESRPSQTEASGKPKMMNEFERREYMARLKQSLK